MRKYFDFNSTRPKSLFEGIDLDNETEDSEDVQFEKPTSNNNELFKEEQQQMQFRRIARDLTQPLFNDTDYKLKNMFFGSYNIGRQQHYTCACEYTRYNLLLSMYVFDFCFETKNLLIYFIKKYMDICVVFPNDIVTMISEFSKHNDNINIYFNEISGKDFQTEADITKSLLNIESIYQREMKYVCMNFPIPHIFFKNFKGFTPNPIKEYPEKRMYPRVKINPSQFEDESDANTLCNMLNAANIKSKIVLKHKAR